MVPGPAGHPSEPQAAGAAGFAHFREVTTDALGYWELRRLFYNALLTAIVVAHGVAAWPASSTMLQLEDVLRLFILAVVANVAYSTVYVADLFIQLSGFRERRALWRWGLLVVGFTFAAVLTHYLSTGVFALPRPN